MLSALLPTQVEEVPPSERRDSMDLEDLDDGDSDVDITSAVNATNVLTEFDVNDNDDNVTIHNRVLHPFGKDLFNRHGKHLSCRNLSLLLPKTKIKNSSGTKTN
jgi:hypothetical protein